MDGDNVVGLVGVQQGGLGVRQWGVREWAVACRRVGIG